MCVIHNISRATTLLLVATVHSVLPHCRRGRYCGDSRDSAVDVAAGRNLYWSHFLEGCTVPVFRRDFALEDAIGSHACSLEALTCV
jgi:hypothetical protein